MQEMKSCRLCKRDLPMNTDYYTKKKDTKDGYSLRCKECCGYKFTDKLTHIPKSGYKFCVKCDRELLIDNRFFPKDISCKDGTRNVCRECSNGKFLKENYIPRVVWNEKDNLLFIERYPHYTNEELIEIFYPNLTEKQLWDKASRSNVQKSEETYWRGRKIQGEKMYGLNSPHYGVPRSEETRKKLSEIAKKRYENGFNYWLGRKRSECEKRHISTRSKGKWSGDKNPRVSDPLKGERNGRWQGGITAKNAKIRNSKEYFDWKISIFKRDKYCCQRCGSKRNIQAHHILNFSEREDLRLDMNNGITLCRSCHCPTIKNSFHSIYGVKNNNYDQLMEFMTGVHWSTLTRTIKNEVSTID